MTPQLTPRQKGDANRNRVHALLAEFPGIFAREIAERLDLSEVTVGRHIKSIRAEWAPARPKKPRRKGETP